MKAEKQQIDELRRALRDAADIVARLDLDRRFEGRVAGWRELVLRVEKVR